MTVSELVLDSATFLPRIISIHVEQVHGHVVFKTMKIFAKLGGVGATCKVGFFGWRNQLLFVAVLHDYLRQYNLSNNSDSWLWALVFGLTLSQRLCCIQGDSELIGRASVLLVAKIVDSHFTNNNLSRFIAGVLLKLDKLVCVAFGCQSDHRL